MKNLLDSIIALIEEARRRVASVANLAQVYANYEIGRRIVEEEQDGMSRAQYGRGVVDYLSAQLTMRFGKGWSARSLRSMRQFYVEYSTDDVRRELFRASCDGNSARASRQIEEPHQIELARASRQFQQINASQSGLVFSLGWTHYLILMRIENRYERLFYEMEAMDNGWSTTELGRQIERSLFSRLAVSRKDDRARLMAYIHRNKKAIVPSDVLKDPYVLDFLGLPERVDYAESDLEKRIIDHIQEFMLELGNGFFFGGRQVRISLGDQHFKIDLVFYNRLLRCFFVIDLKIGRVTHKDIGQMQMYVHYYDREVKTDDENPTIGILLCSDDNRAVVEMTLPECEKSQIFARKYSAVIPRKEMLEKIIHEERLAFESEKLLCNDNEAHDDK